MERGGDQGPGGLAECALRGRRAAGEICTDPEADSGPPAWMCCVTTAAPDVASGAQRDVLMAVVYGGVGENTPASCSRDSPG